MDGMWLIAMLSAFLAVALAIEGVWIYWNDRHGPQARRLARRLAQVSGYAQGGSDSTTSRVSLRAQHEPGSLAGRVVRSASGVWLDTLLRQAGSKLTTPRLLGGMLTGAALAGSVAVMSGGTWLIALVCSAIALTFPLFWLLRRRRQRLARVGEQLPEVVELLARALRAGHALPTALQMAASEGPAPLASEIALVNEEIAFGIAQQEALQKLAQRLPIDDVRYLVIAILLQRETGGNLAELLDNIGRLIRSRLQLQMKVRVLSAEGRLSAWILTVLPFALAGIIAVVNPELSQVLISDPAGIQLVTGSLVMMVLGVIWMRAIVAIRV